MRTEIAELRDNLDMEVYLQDEGIAYKSARGASGPQLNVKECPACSGRKWKVYLNAETGLGNCFSCGQGFNKLTFVRVYMGDPAWPEVFRRIEGLIKETGWRPKKRFTAAVETEKARLPISFPLPTPEGQNLAYLENRGVAGEIAKFFHLRFSESGQWLFKREDDRRGFQDFSNRVIIPVYDLNGEFVTFQGRDVTGAAERKYLFPVGLPGTGRYLYNGQNALRARRAVMGEGAFDVIALKLALDEEVDLRDVAPIGSFGKHLSAGDENGNDQLVRLARLKQSGLEELTIMWDGEVKALEAALEAAKKITPIGLRVRIALLPAGKDPNETSSDVVRQAFRQARVYTSQLGVELRLRNPYARACV